MKRPEHSLQTQIKKWVRECVAEPHVFLAFDRAAAANPRTHLYEAARGIRAGTPDTVLLFRGRSMWVELKAGKNKTSEAQDRLHQEMAAVGHPVTVCWTVCDYWRACLAHGIKLVPYAQTHAEGLDVLLASATPAVPKKTARPRAPRPSSKALALAALAQRR